MSLIYLFYNIELTSSQGLQLTLWALIWKSWARLLVGPISILDRLVVPEEFTLVFMVQGIP